MATKNDVNDLIRLLTVGRSKLSLPAALGVVKKLQDAKLNTLSQIAETDLPTITDALSDAKLAKRIHTSAQGTIAAPEGSNKRKSEPSTSPAAKRSRVGSAYELPSAPSSHAELEASLALPECDEDEDVIRSTVLWTNRAPLVLAFAVKVLDYTMPEQPLSSILSLAQAVVSANSRTKAGSLGIEKGKGAEKEGWGVGQPKVRVMGREVVVLKRGDYVVGDEDEAIESESHHESPVVKNEKSEEQGKVQKSPTVDHPDHWRVSRSISSKQSTFVARSIQVSSAAQARSLFEQLLSSTPSLLSATHHMTAWRISSPSSPSGIIESSNDDGESGGGSHALNILKQHNLTNVMVVCSRWYGGVMLGTDRWRIMKEVIEDALAQRLRVVGTVGREALWGLDLESMRANASSSKAADAMPIFRPEGARAYILKAFASKPEEGGVEDAKGSAKLKKKSGKELEREKERNLGMLLKALDMLYASWAGHVSKEELDRRAWGWYVNVRPEVQEGTAGWGGKNEVRLEKILDLRRKG